MICFHDQSANFNLENQEIIIKWLYNVSEQNNYTIKQLNYIFCSDDDLLEVNKKYLQHDYYTDIITFDLSEIENQVVSDIYVSIDRIIDNASSLSVPFENELLRVLAHGLLHLVGFNDKTENEQAEMTQMENKFIDLYYNSFS